MTKCKMNEHLTDEQIAEALSGTIEDVEVQRHLAECSACSDEVRRMRSGIGGFVAMVRNEAEQRQLLPVMAPKQREHATVTRGLIWAAALVLLATAVSLLRWTPTSSPQQSANVQQSEDTLLLEIQQDLNREVPDALAPALVLTAERNRIIGQERQNQNR